MLFGTFFGPVDYIISFINIYNILKLCFITQVSCSHVKLKLPTYDKDYTSNVAPNVDDFPVVFMETKTRNKEAFTGVSYPCFFIELTHSGSVTQKVIFKNCHLLHFKKNIH